MAYEFGSSNEFKTCWILNGIKILGSFYEF